MVERLVDISPVLINFVVTLISILATYEISKRTIRENRKINEENAGKNRTIYGIELVSISKGMRDSQKNNVNKINEMLNTGTFSIIGVFEVDSAIETMILGKICP